MKRYEGFWHPEIQSVTWIGIDQVPNSMEEQTRNYHLKESALQEKASMSIPQSPRVVEQDGEADLMVITSDG